MFVLSVIMLLLQVKCAFVATDRSTSEAQYCQSKTSNVGLTVYCKGAPNMKQLRRDLKALNTSSLFSLVITDVNASTLPGFLFENLTLNFLRVLRCGIESLDANSLAGVDSLELLDLSKNNLTTVPPALSALKSLHMLYISFNRIATLGLEMTHLSSSLAKINLNGNMISSIHEDALKNMNHLLRFSVNRNKIESIPSSLFRTAPRLQQIDLRWNLIVDVENLFDGLLELHTLKLDENHIRHIRTLSASNLPSLESLSLDYNPIDTFTLFDSRNAAIESLSLQHCEISDVASIPFSCIDRLRFLKLSHNRITHIDSDSFPKSVNTSNYDSFTRRNLYPSKCNTGNAKKAGILLVIDISNNHIDAINNAFHGIQLLEHLDVYNNELGHVPDDVFKTNINLKSLNMRSNRITWIGKHAFRGLASLEELRLSDNRLTSLNGSLNLMPRLKLLYLHDNQLLFLGDNEFSSLPRLRMFYAERNNISDVRGAFKNLVALAYLYLHNNDLMSIHRASFPEEVKGMKRITIEGNPLTCDCQLSWLYEIPELHMDYGVPLCNGPPQLAGAPFLSNETRYSLDIWLEDCDDSCTCTCVAKGYKGSIKVDCSHRNLKTTPRKFPEDTSVIDLSGNLLDTLDVSLAKHASMVQSLNLMNNLYTTIDWNVLPTALSNLFLQNNSFKHFPLNLVNNLNLSEIWLSGNPWDCDCEDYAFRQWAESHEDTVKDAGIVRCAVGPNTRVSSMLFMDLEQKDLCPFKASAFVNYGVPLLVMLSVCLTATMIYLKRERQVKIWLYAHGLRCVKEDDLDKDKLFDVFLSFSSKDSDWAYSKLLPGLEEDGFSVCTYDRNFKGGFLLQDIIQEAVACSRRTLLLLTQNFVESEWCRWEFRVAHHTALQDKINRLIVVVAGKVPEDVDDDLALYMQTTNYLSWGEKHFWDKLRYSLPKKDLKRNQTPGGTPVSIIHGVNIQR